MELTFEDLMFVPSPSSSPSSSVDGHSLPTTYMPMSYREPSPLDRRPARHTHTHTPSPKKAPKSSADAADFLPCPGAAHRKKSRSAAQFYVDPASGVGKCHDPDCTWGYIDGDYIITDLRGYAYSAAGGDPVYYMLPNGGTWKHVRLSSRR